MSEIHPVKCDWKRELTVPDANLLCENTIHKSLGIEITSIHEFGLTGTMPADPRTCQPFGLLHGGASGVLAESLASLAAYMISAPDDRPPVGIQLTVNHIRAAMEGSVFGDCVAISVGKTVQTWSVSIRHSSGYLVAQATVMTLMRPRPTPRT